jgi:hypothetical protein
MTVVKMATKGRKPRSVGLSRAGDGEMIPAASVPEGDVLTVNCS